MRKILKISALFQLCLLSISVFAQDKSFHWGGTSQIFNHGTSNMVSYIDFGEVAMWGYVEITLTSSFNNQLTTGMYGKRYNIGFNLDYTYANESEIFTAFGPVAEQWKLGEFAKNAANHLVIPIYHLANTGNTIHVKIDGVSVIAVNTSLIQLTTPQVVANTAVRDYQHTMGPIAIGTSKIAADSKLTVGGKITARELKVQIDAGADLVFNQDYVKPDLKALAAYVKQNKHLPGIPSEKEMLKSGLEVGAFQIKLLQKIEELTLHLIEKEEEVNALKKRMDQLEAALYKKPI